MKISCEVIQDLLPLYQEEICSDESSKIVEEHIEHCEQCRNVLYKYNKKIDGVDDITRSLNMEEAKSVRKIADRWKGDKKKSFLLGTIIVSIIGCISSVLAYNLSDNYVASDGTLVEAFAYIPIAYIFITIAIISCITLSAMSIIKRLKKYS